MEIVQVLAKEKALLYMPLQSPLTDSNRRPPPYHGDFGPREDPRRIAFYIVLFLLIARFESAGMRRLDLL